MMIRMMLGCNRYAIANEYLNPCPENEHGRSAFIAWVRDRTERYSSSLRSDPNSTARVPLAPAGLYRSGLPPLSAR
ncbi:MAG: hypothetical protein ACXV3D_04285 [Halobacteriota archaeon]